MSREYLQVLWSGIGISRVVQEASVLGPLEFLGGSGALAPNILGEDLQSWCILQKEHFS